LISLLRWRHSAIYISKYEGCGPLGPSSLGSATAFESSKVTEIIAEGDKAVPFLVAALSEEGKPVWGVCHYCFRRVKTDKGKEARFAYIRVFIKGEHA
jgi:hypothetical protein